MEDIFNNELGRKILALTKASFKVSDLIPDLVLREKIKHQVLEVYKTFLIDFGNRTVLIDFGNQSSRILREIDILDHYFYLGGHLNLVKEEHLKQLRNGFLVFKSHIVLLNNNNTTDASKNTQMARIVENSVSNNYDEKDEKIDVRRQEIPDVGRRIKFSDRQEKILKKFQNKETLKLAEILDLFPGVSEKTVRNELSSLIALKKITRSGQGGGSFYQIVR